MNLIATSLLALALTGGGLVSILVWLLILAIIIYVVVLVLNMLPLPPPVKTIAALIIGLVFLIVLLQHLGIAI